MKRLILAAVAVVSMTGCIGSPSTAVRSEQLYRTDVPESALVPYASKRKTINYMTEDGGIGRQEIVEEFAIPQYLASNEFRGSDKFVEKDQAYEFNSTADGQGVMFNQTTAINENAYQDYTNAQSTVYLKAFESLDNLGARFTQVNADNKAAEIQQANIEAQKEIGIAKLQAEHAEPEHPAPGAPVE